MFEAIEATLYPIVCSINEYLSSYILVFLLIGVGLWYSIRTRFVQVRCFGECMRKVFGNLKLHGGKQNSGMTSFQALATAIAAQGGNDRPEKAAAVKGKAPAPHILTVQPGLVGNLQLVPTADLRPAGKAGLHIVGTVFVTLCQ